MLAWGVLAASPVAAQSAGDPARWTELADTIFRNYGPDDGLPISSVTAFAEDGDGFLWVGTSAGLARWDGYRFRVYRKDPADPKALQDDFIWCLQTDSDGRLWIGTNGGGVSRYDRLTDRFVTFSAGPADRGRLSARAMADDGAGGMWVGTDQRLDHLGRDGGLLEDFRHDAVSALLRDRAGGLWVGTSNGLLHRAPGGTGFAPMSLGPAGSGSMAIHALAESSDGRIWVSADHGVDVILPSGRTEEVLPSNPQRQVVRTIAESVPGLMWLGTEGDGVITVDIGSGRLDHVRHDPARASSLPHDYIFSLYRDHSGLLWAGTYSGMGMSNPTQDAVLTIFGHSNKTRGLAGADVLSTLSAAGGKVWVTYLAGGADILDPGGYRLSTLRPDLAHPQNSLPADRIRAIAQGRDGKVYLGTYRGLYQAAPDGKDIRLFPLLPDVPDPPIFSLLSDASGLWIGTRDKGLWRLDYGGKPRRRAASGFANQWISAIAPAANGRIWVGSYQGLYLFDPESERIEQVLPDQQDPQSRSGGLITSLLTDRRGRLWASTRDGIVLVDHGLGIHHIGKAEGLPDLNVDTLLEDGSGAIWASTGSGLIMRIDPETLSLRTLRRADGVGISSFAWNAGSTTPQGELLFGGDGGLLVVRPDRLKSWNWHPPVVVTDLRVGGKQISAPLEGGAAKISRLDIVPKSNSLSVEFAALDYSSPDRNRYAYKLDGYDRDWVETDATRRLASYTNLPPGFYTLRLRGSNRDGVWTEKSLDIPIRVLPAWYQTILFRSTLVVLAALGIWLLVRVRTSYLRHRQVVLESEVAQRTTELKRSNSQLEARTAELGQSLQEVAESRAKVANLLDTSGQGFLSFGANLVIEPDFSRACISMLGLAPTGHKVDALLFPADAAKGELFREVVSGALTSEDPFKRDLLLSLLPATADRLNRLLKLEYRLLDNGHLMVVLTDVTEERRLSRRVESERQRLAMIVSAVTESRDFFDAVEAFRQFFRQDLMQILAARAEPLSVHQEISRQIHTFKGMLAQFNFEVTPQMLHRLEENLGSLRRKGSEMSVGEIVELVLSSDFHGTLETDLTVVRNALGEEFLNQGKRIFLPMSQAKKLRAIADRLLDDDASAVESAKIRNLLEEFRNIDKITLADSLSIYDRSIKQIAKRVDKNVAHLSVVGGDDLWLDPEIYGSFLRSLIHVFRNSVVHGIEAPEERLARGKSPVGKIECVIRRDGPGFTLTIADDGSGIEVGALRERAMSLGLMSEAQAEDLSEGEAIALIFADGISARKQADELAGRGIGLAAVRAETRALGGEVTVTSSPGQGACFVFSFPFPESGTEREAGDVTGM